MCIVVAASFKNVQQRNRVLGLRFEDVVKLMLGDEDVAYGRSAAEFIRRLSGDSRLKYAVIMPKLGVFQLYGRIDSVFKKLSEIHQEIVKIVEKPGLDEEEINRRYAKFKIGKLEVVDLTLLLRMPDAVVLRPDGVYIVDAKWTSRGMRRTRVDCRGGAIEGWAPKGPRTITQRDVFRMIAYLMLTNSREAYFAAPTEVRFTKAAEKLLEKYRRYRVKPVNICQLTKKTYVIERDRVYEC